MLDVLINSHVNPGGSLCSAAVLVLELCCCYACSLQHACMYSIGIAKSSGALHASKLASRTHLWLVSAYGWLTVDSEMRIETLTAQSHVICMMCFCSADFLASLSLLAVHWVDARQTRHWIKGLCKQCSQVYMLSQVPGGSGSGPGTAPPSKKKHPTELPHREPLRRPTPPATPARKPSQDFRRSSVKPEPGRASTSITPTQISNSFSCSS